LLFPVFIARFGVRGRWALTPKQTGGPKAAPLELRRWEL
jgi:hypothetical protein